MAIPACSFDFLLYERIKTYLYLTCFKVFSFYMVQGMGYSGSNNFVMIFQKHSEIRIYKLSYDFALRSLNSMTYSVKCLQ